MLEGHPEIRRADVLVNSASVFPRATLASVTPGAWREIFDVNALAPLLIARALAADAAQARRPLCIVNISDLYARRPDVVHAAYCASKAALESITRALAVEFAPHVRANAVAPGAVLFPEEADEERRARIVTRVPLRRAGAPEDVANACVFLAEADYVNASLLPVDGGASL